MPLPIFYPTQNSKEEITQLLKMYGRDTLSYFHLQDNRQYFFSPSGKSFLSYRIERGVAVVAGDPVGPEDEIESLLSSFIAYMSIWKLKPCFLGSSSEYLLLFQRLGLHSLKIGEEAILSLETFEKSNLKKKVRRAQRHINNVGIEIYFFTAEQLPGFIKKQLLQISEAWLVERGRKEKGFSMTLGRFPQLVDKDYQFVVAMKEDLVIGYLCFAPVYQQNAFSLDHMRRCSDAPNGLNEALIISSAEYFKKRHVAKLSLNFATFSHDTQGKKGKHHMYKLVSQVLMKVYKCDTLRAFNEKFLPTWESRYIVYPSKKNIPWYAMAIHRLER